MKSESQGTVLSTIFVDYDNIYLSLRRKSEEAAKRFAKDSALWLRELESGRLITPTNGLPTPVQRRIVMSRCYGNPVPRRNSGDNSTDMNSFPFVRHHFLRAGFEVIDCPPLTAQLKNSADIRMVMDVRDYLNHETRFGEFIILSGDADFTPVLHRLRAHARRTVVFANDHTAAPYTAISDGEVREADLIALLLEGRIGETKAGGELKAPLTGAELGVMRKEIVEEVVTFVRSAPQPVPLEVLADRAVRALGHERTVGASWGGAGTFRDLLVKSLPADIRISEQAPFYAFDVTRQAARSIEARPEFRERRSEPAPQAPTAALPIASAPVAAQSPSVWNDGRPELQRAESRSEKPEPARSALQREPVSQRSDSYEPEFAASPRYDRAPAQAQAPISPPLARGETLIPGYGTTAQPQSARAQALQPQHAAERPDVPGRSEADLRPQQPQPHYRPQGPQQPLSQGAAYDFETAPQAPQQRAPAPAAPAPSQRQMDSAAQIQQSIARIHEACQAPPLSPPEYRVLFEVMAEEINANNLSGAQTLINIVQRAAEMGLEVRRDDVRFVLEVVSEADPWFEQGASANLFAGRFRNFVVARCRSQGLNLSADEIDLVDAWFGGAPASQRVASQQKPAYKQAAQSSAAPAGAAQGRGPGAERWGEDGRYAQGSQGAAQGFAGAPDDEFPRIVRSSRLRG